MTDLLLLLIHLVHLHHLFLLLLRELHELSVHEGLVGLSKGDSMTDLLDGAHEHLGLKGLLNGASSGLIGTTRVLADNVGSIVTGPAHHLGDTHDKGHDEHGGVSPEHHVDRSTDSEHGEELTDGENAGDGEASISLNQVGKFPPVGGEDGTIIVVGAGGSVAEELEASHEAGLNSHAEESHVSGHHSLLHHGHLLHVLHVHVVHVLVTHTVRAGIMVISSMSFMSMSSMSLSLIPS